MYGDNELWEFMHSKWEMEVYQTEKERIWIALGASKRKEHIHRLAYKGKWESVAI